MEDHFISFILSKTKAKSIYKTTVIQELWSGYGEIIRAELIGTQKKAVIVKYIDLKAANSHPRGWATSVSHERKIKSYETEINWYQNYNHLLNENTKTPECLGILSKNNKHCIVLEDLNESGYINRINPISHSEIKTTLKWLANFHGFHLKPSGIGLWKTGTYWHLNTRPDELKAIKLKEVKNAASYIDSYLNKAKYQTLVHGDAKLANFCFSNKKVAAVDFQYVGKGCGMKDVAYFLSSCLNENQLPVLETKFLDEYFKELKLAIKDVLNPSEILDLEKEWRTLYTYAWADFTRFLLGWMPTHQKLNSYSMSKMNEILKSK